MAAWNRAGSSNSGSLPRPCRITNCVVVSVCWAISIVCWRVVIVCWSLGVEQLGREPVDPDRELLTVATQPHRLAAVGPRDDLARFFADDDEDVVRSRDLAVFTADAAKRADAVPALPVGNW